MALWSGQTASQIGSALTVLVLPLLAIEELGAGPQELGILRAMFAFAAIIAAAPSGVMVDRARKRHVMVGCDLVLAASLASVPVMAHYGVLTMLYLYVVAFVNGVFGMIYGIAYHAYVPQLVGRALLQDANSKIAATESAARISGPALGAAMAAWIGAALTLVLDAFTYLFSAVLTWFFTPPEKHQKPAADEPRPSMWVEARDGVRVVFANPTLTQTALTTIGSMMALAMVDAVLIYYMVTVLDVSKGVLGAVLAFGEAGGLIAAALASKLMTTYGGARMMWIAAMLSPLAFLPLLATPATAPYLITVYIFCTAARFVTFDIAQYVYRQSACPPEMFGRMTASIRLGIAVSMMIGALLGGFFGDLYGPKFSLGAAAVVVCVASLPVLFSPQLQRAKHIDELPGCDGEQTLGAAERAEREDAVSR